MVGIDVIELIGPLGRDGGSKSEMCSGRLEFHSDAPREKLLDLLASMRRGGLGRKFSTVILARYSSFWAISFITRLENGEKPEDVKSDMAVYFHLHLDGMYESCEVAAETFA